MKDWFYNVSNEIQDRVEDFYTTFYPEFALTQAGKGFRLEPCPVCGHKDCCSIGEIGVNCFSCGWKGSHINAYIDYATNIQDITQGEAMNNLAQWSNCPLPEMSEEEQEQHKKRTRTMEIQRYAENFYHEQLINCTKVFKFENTEITPLSYLLNVRRRSITTITDFKIGFSNQFSELQQQLLTAGYTREEIKDANIWIPEGLFVFFYKNPVTKEITRVNTKNPFHVMHDIKNEMGEIVKSQEVKGFSIGDKAFYFCPGFTFRKPFIICEGEHDMYSIYEQECKNVCCIGGNIKDETWEVLEKAQDKIYTMFDNDETGGKYVDRINHALPEKDIYRISYDKAFKDPDDYFRSAAPLPLPELIKGAQQLMTTEFKISHDGFRNWKIENRFKTLDFQFLRINDKGQIVGTSNLVIDGNIVERCDNTALVACKTKMKPMNFILDDEITVFFNARLEDKTSEELIDIYAFSANKDDIRRILANRLIKSNNQDEMVVRFKERLKGRKDCDDIIDGILKEVNDIQNKSVTSFDEIPKIRVCQYFNVRNNDAYFYFTNVKHDGETVRRLPYLLRNDKTLIRLDLFKRKDDQCLLLIDNKYELPEEQTVALNSTSLTQNWVDEYINDRIPQTEINPFNLVTKIEDYIKRFYYTTDQTIYKVLALYCYMTYYYEVLGEVPYLYLNGEKGSGKSILDTVLSMFCFNAKMGVSITSIEGGTMILDEIENLTSRTKANDSLMGAILKGGYTKNSFIYRMNTDKGVVESFDSFGPKIISNIFGLEDVVLDRCIQINTYRLKITNATRMEDPRYYLAERMGEIREITSKCCLSALEYFQELHTIFRNGVFEAETARLSQILTSMLAVARLVDIHEESAVKSNSYETALVEFYKNSIKSIRQDTDESTPEGIIKMVVPKVAKELLGIIPVNEHEYIVPTKHKYQEPIQYNLDEGWFKINVLHFKCFIEENMPGETIHTRYVPRFIKSTFNFKDKDYVRKSTKIDNEDLLKEFKGNMSPKVNYYTFYFKDYVESNFLKDNSSFTSHDDDTNVDIY